MKGKKGYPLGARIKRLMQTDDDVGKIASATPIVVGRAMELFLKKLCDKSAQIALSRHSKTLLGSHLKSYVMSEPLMDFIKQTVSSAPDLPDDDYATGTRAKRPRTFDASDESTSTAGVSRGRGRPPLSGRGGRGRGRPPLARNDPHELPSAKAMHRPMDDPFALSRQSSMHQPPFSLAMQNPSNSFQPFAHRDYPLQLHPAHNALKSEGGSGIPAKLDTNSTFGHAMQQSSSLPSTGPGKRILLDLNELPTDQPILQLSSMPMKHEPTPQHSQPVKSEPVAHSSIPFKSESSAHVNTTLKASSSPAQEEVDVGQNHDAVAKAFQLPVLPAALLTTYTQSNPDEDDDYDA